MSQSLVPNETNYLICFDTFNKSTSNATIEGTNATNDVVIDLQALPRRLPAVAVSVGSLEIPLTQMTVESSWNQFYFSENYEPFVTDGGSNVMLANSDGASGTGSNMAMTQLVFDYTLADGLVASSVVHIPPSVNPIVSATVIPQSSTVDNLSMEFKTLWPHQLILADFYNWSPSSALSASSAASLTSSAVSSAMKLIATPISGIAGPLNSLNSSLIIVDDYRFQLVGLAVENKQALVLGAQASTSSPSLISAESGLKSFGYLHTPPIPGPVHLVNILNALIQNDPLLSENHVSLAYIPNAHQIRFQFVPTSSNLVTKHQKTSTAKTASQNPSSTIQNSTIASLKINQYTDPSLDLQSRIITSISLINSNPSSDSLALRLGFMDPNTTLTRQSSAKTGLGLLHWSTVKIDPGNYNGSSLAANLSLQLNRFYFQRPYTPVGAGLGPAPMTVPNYTQKFAFSDPHGTTHIIDIPYGTYNAGSFALFLEQQMNSKDTSGTTYTVIYNKDRFTIASNSQTGSSPKFGLEFSVAAASSPQLINPTTGVPIPNIPTRLGFSAIPYRGHSSYTSTTNVYVPRSASLVASYLNKQNSSTALSNRGLAFVWNVSFNPLVNKFTIDPITPSPVAGTIKVDSASDNGISTKLIFADAHGFQAGHAILVNFPSVTSPSLVVASFPVLITKVLDAFTVLIDVGSHYHSPIGTTTAPLAWSSLTTGTTPITAQLHIEPTGNVYMAPIGNSSTMNASGSFGGGEANSLANFNSDLFNQLPANILGFNETDYYYYSDGTLINDNNNKNWLTNTVLASQSLFPLTSPNTADLDGPGYLLLQLVDPPVSTHLQHRYKQDLKQNLLAKIQLHVPGCHKIERFLHVQGLLGGAYSILGSVRLRLLNPNHTLYQLHNKNWSGTLSVTALQDRAQLRS